MGAASNNAGTVFWVLPWVLPTQSGSDYGFLHDFTTQDRDALYPAAHLVPGDDGTFYGITVNPSGGRARHSVRAAVRIGAGKPAQQSRPRGLRWSDVL